MRNVLLAAVVAAGFVAPAFAQDAATMVCSDYAKLDNAGQMAVVADLESMNAEMASGNKVSSDEIATFMNTQCAADPNKLLQDAMKEMHKM